jgi:NADH-quinone oxidoreductase subunit N
MQLTGAANLNLHAFEIFAPQSVILLTVLALALMAWLYPDRQRTASVMICFTGLVVAALAQLKTYPIFFVSTKRILTNSSLILDPQSWILTLAILLLATVAVLMRRLRNYSGRGDGRFCLSIAISSLAWSLLPAAGSFPMIAACVTIASVPLLFLSAFNSKNLATLPLQSLGLLSALLVMLLALWPLELTRAASDFADRSAHGLHSAVFPWAGIVAVLFILPILFWTGCQPLNWWFGISAEEQTAEAAFFQLLVPPVACMATLLRIIPAVQISNPDSAGVVITVIGVAGILGILTYGYNALKRHDIRSIAGNMTGILSAATLITLCAAQYSLREGGARLVEDVVLYALTAALATGLALGVLATEKVRTLQELPEFFSNNKLRVLVFMLALLSLAGLPPTMGFIQRFDLLRIFPHASTFWTQLILIINAGAVILGSLAALRVVAYAQQEPATENVNSAPGTHSPRRMRRRAWAPLLLLLLASIVNGTALLAYNPIQSISAAFMPHQPPFSAVYQPRYVANPSSSTIPRRQVKP